MLQTKYTDREKDVLHGLAEGKTRQAIAETLGVGLETVRTHIRRIRAKTQIKPPKRRTRAKRIEYANRLLGKGLYVVDARTFF